ncbi:hypothetical protein [Candidatus Methylacidithermus pantelleriae]|nr:hypothetical protein [Candidatus Methylacidithermus pantelleriae]
MDTLVTRAGKRIGTPSQVASSLSLGSKDKTAGNHSCQATVSPDGSLLALGLRLPDGWGARGNSLFLKASASSMVRSRSSIRWLSAGG